MVQASLRRKESGTARRDLACSIGLMAITAAADRAGHHFGVRVNEHAENLLSGMTARGCQRSDVNCDASHRTDPAAATIRRSEATRRAVSQPEPTVTEPGPAGPDHRD